ncbi:DUF3726 domain-containing protein [Mesorhizobium sp. SP-1A]|uniref:DUF3726 domain-containing protein n=1 Tax=Mesorhizobium sp. SP-1A TaxID=3077840 RepID=UPI0028F7283E|nr:DUF3726 domain-containing protein [Mesorhizobium sp. SP-1A]
MEQARRPLPHREAPPAAVPLRAPDTVMRLARLGSFHQTRLSFMRVLLRRLAHEGWTFARTVWNVDAKGVGHAVYEARGNGRVYSLVAFANDLDPAKRTDRVIAEEWDATFALHDGVVTRADIERLSRNVPRQEAGRCSAAELVLARANKSVRLFDLVAGTLAAGSQPEAAELDAVGYLMRTTAVYGSGKFGLADHEAIRDRPEFSGPFAAEMLTVWLIRAYTVDLVEHAARILAPETAVRLDGDLRRRLGVGNSTGLGMAPFLVTHAPLVDRWIAGRETALARVRAVRQASAAEIATFRDMLARGRRQMEAWTVEDAVQMARIEGLRRDLDTLSSHIAALDLSADFAWDELYRLAEERLGLEAQEFLVTLLIEPYGHLVDDLADTMACDEARTFRIDGSATLASLSETIDASYGFALATDFDSADATARFWYVSEEKLEPRLGERASDEGAALEQPLGVARDVKALHQALRAYPAETRLASFLLERPEFRHVARRAQIAAEYPYAEIRDNLIDAAMRPIDLLRCKLSFFGASGFDPRSDRWVRIALFRHAPFPDEFGAMDPDDWAIPPIAPPARPADRRAPAETVPPAHGLAAGNEDFCSLNEIDALVRKAARGAGLSWGLAEEAGKCARALAGEGEACLPLIADVLELQLGGDLSRRIAAERDAWSAADDLPINPLVLGPSLADHAFLLARGSIDIAGPVAAPALLLPFLSAAASHLGAGVKVETDRGECAISVAADIGTVPPALAGLVQRLRLSQAPAGTDHAACRPAPVRPVYLPPELKTRFEALAARTYVPSSELSRMTGAGAGLNDND